MNDFETNENVEQLPDIEVIAKKLKLEDLTVQERISLIEKLLTEQVAEQRFKLKAWRDLTNQPAHIDTGYVGQHLVSLVTGIRGGGFRGKGLDLADRSEIKSANFLDSLDKNGRNAPRWNFESNDLPSMEALLDLPAIYLVSIDFNPRNLIRVRIWTIYPRTHKEFSTRYIEWMEKLGKPKLLDPERPSANFQLFPPRNNSLETYARHGKGGLFSKLRIELESPPCSNLIFHAEEQTNPDGPSNFCIISLLSGKGESASPLEKRPEQ